MGLSPLAMPFLHGETQEHGRPAALAARHLDGAAVLLHDGLRNRQPEPGAPGLGREERIEKLGEHAARHADAGVADAHALDLGPRPDATSMGRRVARAPAGAARRAAAAALAQ